MDRVKTLAEHRSAFPDIRADFTVDQNWSAYTSENHAVWANLYRRQTALLAGLAAAPFLEGVRAIGLDSSRIPDMEALSARLMNRTGWRIVPVPGLVPDDIFFAHLAARRFPACVTIRKPSELDYAEDLDLFHDVFGHAPMLALPVFADFMQAFGVAGLKAISLGRLKQLARLYWWTVEFGLIDDGAGLRIYGSGIVGSRIESRYAVASADPVRLAFDLVRMMRTSFETDELQRTYFVAPSFEALLAACGPQLPSLYERAAALPALKAGDIENADVLYEPAQPPADAADNRPMPSLLAR